jgi:hypothetical protein
MQSLSRALKRKLPHHHQPESDRQHTPIDRQSLGRFSFSVAGLQERLEPKKRSLAKRVLTRVKLRRSSDAP